MGHALAQIAATLRDDPDASRQPEVSAVRRYRYDNIEAARGGQIAQQSHQGGGMETERGPLTDVLRQSALYRPQARCASEDNNRVFHP
jgi:hypothetical protein